MQFAYYNCTKTISITIYTSITIATKAIKTDINCNCYKYHNGYTIAKITIIISLIKATKVAII